MSLTVQQLLLDAKRLSTRLRDHDVTADKVISSAQSVLKEVEAMRQYQEDIDSLNSIAHNRPRAQLVLGIQQENRHIRQLQHENKELRAALEEHQKALELIMSKYRKQTSCLIKSTKFDETTVSNKKSAVLQERADKICEMAFVMQKSIEADEANYAKEHELMSRLITENKGLREMLEISCRNGSYSNPLVGPKMMTRSCQTETELDSSEPPDSTIQSKDINVEDGGQQLSKTKSNGLRCIKPRTYSEGDDESLCGRATSSMNGSLSPHARETPDIPRPVSSASEESEDAYSTSEEDEIIFNTIKRQVKKQIFASATVSAVAVSPSEVDLSAVNITSSNNDNEEVTDLKVNGDNSHMAECLLDQQTEVLSQS